ncbi:DHA2 family efflux MFS transporter permease subunit [Alicyclobacillaceae bacterium I2511]|nr:DHA2 family efflux MFS transporter permease subunit [Alicyclobacillaceae bacterium I2511]
MPLSSQVPSTSKATLGSRLPLPTVRKRPGYHWYVVATVCVGAFMAALDASIVNIALPKMESAFNVSLATVEWVSLTYLLTLASLIVPLGRLADMLGRRWMYAIGFTVFIIGSLLCGIAIPLWFLLAARVLQAIGAAMLQANSVSIITAVTPAKDRGKAIGIQGSAQAVGLSLGPAIGGALVAFAGWRWIFFVNLPVGIIGTLLGILILPADAGKKHREPFDFLGTAILAPTLVAFIYVLNTGIKSGWGSPLVLTGMAITLLGLASFGWVEKRSTSPLVDLSLFRIPVFTTGNITGVLSFAVMYAVTLLGPFYLEYVRRLDPFQSGLYMTMIPIGMAIFTPVAGALADHFGTRMLTSAGMTMAIVGCVVLAFVSNPATAMIGYMAGLFFVGLALGLFTPPNNSSIMGSAPRTRLGVAGGILNMSRTLGMQLGVTLGGLSYQVFLMVHGATSERSATVAQMVPSFRDSYMTVAGMAAIALLLSAAKRINRTSAVAKNL